MKHIKTFEGFVNENNDYRTMMIQAGTEQESLELLKKANINVKMSKPPEYGGDYEFEFRTEKDAQKAEDILAKHFNESEEMNEGSGDTVARDYEADLLSDIDSDDFYLSDNGIQWLDATAKSFGDNKKVYMTNKSHVEYHGKDWKTLLLLLKSKGVRYHTYDDDKDSFVLFSR
jgi:hypothetical protein